MKNDAPSKERLASVAPERIASDKPLHPAWHNFILYCSELKHGEIEMLKIQDGLPVLAEVIRKKVKFAP